MSNNSNFKTTESIKPSYDDRPSPREVPEKFQELYVDACRETNELLASVDEYFAFDEVYQTLTQEQEEFREDDEHEVNLREVSENLSPGELVDEDEFYESLVELAGSDTIEDISQLSSVAQAIESKRNNVGESMHYSNPVTWMMYKREAYVGKDENDSYQEMQTMGDLRRHANGQDLCQKRYDFMKEFVLENTDWDIRGETDISADTESTGVDIPDDTALENVYTDERVLGLLDDVEFMGRDPRDVERVHTGTGISMQENEAFRELNELREIAHIAGVNMEDLVERREEGQTVEEIRNSFSSRLNAWKVHEFDEDGKWANY